MRTTRYRFKSRNRQFASLKTASLRHCDAKIGLDERPRIVVAVFKTRPRGTDAFQQSSYVYILCDADASAGTFTVPSVILNLLPTNGYGTFTQKGVNISIAGIPETSFTVTGSPGVDAAVFSVFVSNGSVAAIQ